MKSAMKNLLLMVLFLVQFYAVIAKDCPCIHNLIGQIRCPGSGENNGYFNGYGHCSSREASISTGCNCYGCSTCDDN